MIPVLGRPGVRAASTAVQGFISRDGNIGFWPRGAVLDGAKTRDPSNTANILALRPGLALGKVTASGKLANSILCLTAGALTGAGTTLTLTVAGAAELYRRVGATGTFKLIGPPTAAGTVQTRTVTYSAINLNNGQVTITALGTNQKERIRFNIAASGGNLQLNVAKTDGTFVTTADIARNATDATYLAAINSALDTATGVVGGIVATAISATDTDLGFELTYSGTGYAGGTWRRAEVVVYPTSSTAASYEPVTTAAQGAFVTASIVAPTDGSETPTTVVPDGIGILMASDSRDIEMPHVPCSMIVDVARFIDYPADASLKTWVRQSMDAANGKGKFIFSDAFP